MTQESTNNILVDGVEIADIFSDHNVSFNPPVLSLEEKIRENAALIADGQRLLDNHPEMKNSLTIALNSAFSLQREMVIDLAKKQGIPAERDVLAVEVSTNTEGFPSIPLEQLLSLSSSIRRLLHSLKDAFRKKHAKRGVELTLRFAAPFAASFGFFLVPQITLNTRRRKNINIQETISFTVEEFVLAPLKRLLTASRDEDSLRACFSEMGASVASDYEKYLNVISSMDISVSLYSSKIAFPLNKKTADQVLSKMSSVGREPIEESLSGRVQSLDIVNDKRRIVFVVEKGMKIESTFEDSIFTDIHNLFNKDVEACFDHKITINAMTGNESHDWHLKSIEEIPEEDEDALPLE
ncbi:MAG: hypothetical protein ACOYJV_01525 [Aminivibrio sp.]|jgi:hypothetical protein